MKKTKFPLVRVEWDDSALPVSKWQWIEDYELPETVDCISVGFLIAETKTALALAPNLGNINGDSPQACGIFRIPRSAVRRITRL